jgi:amphiphysin
MEIIKAVRKSCKKRDNKQLDFDRHTATLKKLQEKKDKSLKDEKALYKAENDVDMATQEYEYFNNLVKADLPVLFQLEKDFIQPLFQSFYYMQLNVFYTLHEVMQSIDIGYFNLTLDIEEGFQEKRGEIQAQTEALSIVKFKTTGGPRKPLSKYGANRLEGPKPRLALENGSAGVSRRQSTDTLGTGPPPYSPSGTTDISRAHSTGSHWASAAKSKAAPPPPKPKPGRLSALPAAETVTALYDYEAQAEGDLSFSAGDVIEIVTRTANENEWWIGKISGKQGQFPGEFGCFFAESGVRM